MVFPLGRIDEFSDVAGSSWAPVPRMTHAVSNKYAADSSAHREAHGRASALERSILRQSRQASQLESEVIYADQNLAPILEKEIVRLLSRVASQSAELDAWRKEYNDLPAGIYRYMPATLHMTFTETREEKQLLQILASLLEENNSRISSSISERIYRGDWSGLIGDGYDQ
jgi:hypothetical protein